MEYQVEVLREQHEDFTNFLSEKIRAYNNEQSLHHRESRQQGAVLPLQLIVTDQQQQWIGGITAEVYWGGWVEIHKFWFSEEYRGKGMGKKLLAQAEWVAKDMGGQQRPY